MTFKIFRKNCYGLGVHKTWIYACIGIADTNKPVFLPFQKTFKNYLSGLRNILVLKFAWNPLANAGFLSLISSRKPVLLHLLIQNIRNLKRETKPIVKMQNGFATYLCVI